MSGNVDTKHFNTIDEAIAEIKAGKIVIVVDDNDRENEGDFVCAAEFVTPEVVNFLATHGRGIICAPLETLRAKELALDLMGRPLVCRRRIAPPQSEL